ncbi:kinase-like protein [Imleria badia]|nr:kinase-like protein [Imleria badia]
MIPRTDDSIDGTSPAAEEDEQPNPNATRRAHACTFCRRLKMTCYGAEQGPCKRCLAGNHECIFEGSNRGKPSAKKPINLSFPVTCMTSDRISRSPYPVAQTAQTPSGMFSCSPSTVYYTPRTRPPSQSPSPPPQQNCHPQSATLPSLSPKLPDLPPLPPLGADQLSAPDHPIAPSTHPHLSTIGTSFPLPPDLTPYIFKVDDHYVAGGGFGDVYRCWYAGGSALREVAVKAFRFTFAIDGDVTDRSAKMLRRELGIWRRLSHVNIVPFLGIAHGFGMRGAMSLVSSWMPNESLHHFLLKHDDNLAVGHRLRLLLDIANGLHYLHSFPIVHGDLNCNNVLLDADYTARLADFGYASLVGNIPEALSYLQRSTTRPGALRWIAPEQIESEEPFSQSPKSDIYSFGCVALQVLSGKQPWSDVVRDAAIVRHLVQGHKPARPMSRAIDDSHWSLIQDCWSVKEERPAAEVIITTIQLFLNHCSQSPPLRDMPWSSHSDSLVDLSSSSLTQTTMEDLRRNIDILDTDNQRR